MTLLFQGLFDFILILRAIGKMEKHLIMMPSTL